MSSFNSHCLKGCTALAAAALLTACGNGGGEATKAADIEIIGRVVDGYIQGATVFWDCNDNRMADTTEVSATTTAGGFFSIKVAPAPTCALAAAVGIGAIDSDDPGNAIIKPYILLAAPGKTDLITPLTTMVQGILKANPGMTLDAADRQVVADLGLGSSALANYMPDTTTANRQTQVVAQYVAQGLAQRPVSDATSANKVYASTKAAINKPAFLSALLANYIPFRFRPDGVIDTLRFQTPTPNLNNVVVLAEHRDTPANQAFMKTIADAVTADQNAGYGGMYLSEYSEDTLKAWAMGIQSRKLGDNNPQASATIQRLRAERNARLAELRLLIQNISDDTGFFTSYARLFTTDGRATFDYVLASTSAVIAIELDAVDLYTFGSLQRVKKLSGLTGVNHIKATKERLGAVITRIGLAPSGLECFVKANDYAEGREIVTRDLIRACKDLAVGLIDSFEKLKRLEKLAGAASITLDAGILANADFSQLTTKEKTRAYLKHVLDTFDAIKDTINLMDAGGALTQPLAALDVARQLGGMYINALEFTDTALAVDAQAIADFDQQSRLVFSQYYASYVGAFSWYFRVVDKTKDAYLTEALPLQVPAGRFVTFTVNGRNIALSSALKATLGATSCNVDAGSNSSQLAVTCMAGAAAGPQLLSVSIAGVDIVGSPFAVAVQDGASLSINFDAASRAALSAVALGKVDFIDGRNGGVAAKFYGVAAPGALRIPNSSAMQFSDGMTWDMWVRRDGNVGINGNGSTVTGTFVMSVMAKSHDAAGVAVNSLASGESFVSTFMPSWAYSEACTVTPQPAVPLGTWYRITFTASARGGTAIYINKGLQTQCRQTALDFTLVNAQDLFIGRYSAFWYPLDGAVQDIRIYKRVLSTAEVSALP